MRENHYLVPVQLDGLEKDINYNVSAHSTEDAEDLFVDAKERLLDVNNWSRYGAMTDTKFKLTDSHGKLVNRRARKGDHIRIELPGAGITESFDWVMIEAIEYDDYPDLSMETFAVRLRPTDDPLFRHNGSMFGNANDATSTLVIERRSRQLFGAYHGRNEGDAEGEEAGDVLVMAGPWLGLTDVQWGSLVKGLIG